MGAWMSDLAWARIPSEYLARLLDWLIGSLVLAPILATIAALIVYVSVKCGVWSVKRRKRGNALGLAWFRMLVRLGGLRTAYAMLYPVCLHYALFDRTAVRSALPYIRHRFVGLSRFGQWLAAYRIFLEQGRMLIDRHAALARPALVDITIDADAETQLRSLAFEGGILLMSHAGNWQAAIPTLALLGKPVHLVMALETNAAVAKTLKVNDGHGAVNVIDAAQFMEAAPKIVNALNAGEIVSFMGDRSYGAADAPVPFLGGTARFPVAAFRIAASTGKPVCFLFVPRTGRGRYLVQVPATVTPHGRADITPCLTRYAEALEAFAQAHPHQCFPFADLWA
jgi:predicted LPLAT superfamily acyltransferase